MEPAIHSRLPVIGKPLPDSGRPRASSRLVLTGLMVVWAAAASSADDPPADSSPQQQRIADLVAQILPSDNPAAANPRRDAEFEANPPTEPLDSSSVSMTDTGLLEVLSLIHI